MLVAAVAGAAGCRTAAGPEDAAHAYAAALRDDRLAEAYGMTSASFRSRVTMGQFQERYARASLRAERAAAIDRAAEQLRAEAQGVEEIREEGLWRIDEPADDREPRASLTRFLDAAERGDFQSAYEMLSASLRARYTPERLKADFAREPLAQERLARARQAAQGPAVMRPDGAEFPLAAGKAVRLVREGGAFKVAALE